MQRMYAAAVAALLLAPAVAFAQQSQSYRNLWSAQEMIGTEVIGEGGEQIGEVKDIIVGQDGHISKVVVEVGGWLEMGDQHIGVPWQNVKIGPDMESVRVPALKEIEDGTYSLFGRVPQGEDVAAAQGAWRVNELIGDYASLRDVPRYGLVTDVLFDQNGDARTVVVRRTAGAWGPIGWYGYPYAGYYPGAYAYPLPYSTADVGRFQPFDYVAFAQTSDLAGDGNGRPGQASAGDGARQDDMRTFRQLDRNDDGRLSRSEYQAFGGGNR